MESWRERKNNEKTSCQTICIETNPGCKANVVDHGKDVGRAQVTTGHEGLIVNMISIWYLRKVKVHLEDHNLEEMKISNKFHVVGKCLPQSQPMVLVSSWSPGSWTLTAFAKDIF